MGLNLSNRQIALELGLSPSDVQAMTEHLPHREQGSGRSSLTEHVDQRLREARKRKAGGALERSDHDGDHEWIAHEACPGPPNGRPD